MFRSNQSIYLEQPSVITLRDDWIYGNSSEVINRQASLTLHFENRHCTTGGDTHWDVASFNKQIKQF